MKVWLYYRLSRDEDEELNSLTNQRKIIYDYAVKNNYVIVGESFDDNVSGMHFNREGISKIYDAVENKKIDAVIVKDLSRLGRHRTQTALFIDYLRENNVRVLSVTENIDTTNENDDLIVGFKGLLNDFYAKDISRKITAAYRQKQKDSGVIAIPPFGYFKDRNTGQIVIVEEAADTVRYIYDLYLNGYGLVKIAKILNKEGRATPAKIQDKILNKRLPYTLPKISSSYLWVNTTVKRILTDEAYTGTLVNHKTETSTIHKKTKFMDSEKQFRHENFYPIIISQDQWEQVQFLLKERVQKNVRASTKSIIHRYSGLLKCGDCGSCFVAKKRTFNGNTRIEYVCNAYHRYGKGYCLLHRIREETLDEYLYHELLYLKTQAQNNWKSIQSDVEKWAKQNNNLESKIQKLREKSELLEQDIEGILMERIRDKANTERYNRMIEKKEMELDNTKKEIEKFTNLEQEVKNRRSKIKTSIDLLDDILASRNISETHLRMLIEKIIITEKDGQLDVEFQVKADFQTHSKILVS